MRERPIIFNAHNVRAILAGRKTQTRRVVKPQPEWVQDDAMFWKGKAAMVHAHGCPYGKPGDRLWVREAFVTDGHEYVCYRADADNGDRPCDGCEYPDGSLVALETWKPSIHMPRWASRITLEITGVWVERLQEISEEDAQAEGAPFELHTIDSARLGANSSHRAGFERTWRSINGPDSWLKNPWVWVVEFRFRR